MEYHDMFKELQRASDRQSVKDLRYYLVPDAEPFKGFKLRS